MNVAELPFGTVPLEPGLKESATPAELKVNGVDEPAATVFSVAVGVVVVEALKSLTPVAVAVAEVKVRLVAVVGQVGAVSAPTQSHSLEGR